MKKYFLLLNFLLPFLVNAQTSEKSYALTDQDRKNYVLHIDQKDISKPITKKLGQKNETFVNVRLILKNNSNDTLKFLSMTCSWEDIYEIDNKSIIIWGHDCNENAGTIISLAPHQTRSMNMQLFNKNALGHNYKFRIGLHLFKCSKYDRSIGFEGLISTNKLPKNNLIWSNEVDLLKK